MIERQTTDQVADKILEAGQGRRAFIMAPVVRGRKGEFAKLFEDLRREGFSRVRVDGEVRSLDDSIELDLSLIHIWVIESLGLRGPLPCRHGCRRATPRQG